MKEEWREVIGYEGYYMVSNIGRVKSVDREVRHKGEKIQNKKGKVLRPGVNQHGYPQVYLSKLNKSKTLRVHRLVAEAFLLGDSSLIVNHLDGVKTNNEVSNLEWTTYSGNNQHAWDTGLRPRTGPRKLSNGDIISIKIWLQMRYPTHSLSRAYGVSERLVRDIREGRCWSHIK